MCWPPQRCRRTLDYFSRPPSLVSSVGFGNEKYHPSTGLAEDLTGLTTLP